MNPRSDHCHDPDCHVRRERRRRSVNCQRPSAAAVVLSGARRADRLVCRACSNTPLVCRADSNTERRKKPVPGVRRRGSAADWSTVRRYGALGPAGPSCARSGAVAVLPAPSDHVARYAASRVVRPIPLVDSDGYWSSTRTATSPAVPSTGASTPNDAGGRRPGGQGRILYAMARAPPVGRRRGDPRVGRTKTHRHRLLSPRLGCPASRRGRQVEAHPLAAEIDTNVTLRPPADGGGCARSRQQDRLPTCHW